MMQANGANLRRAGLLLRGMAGKASWRPDVFVGAREVAAEKALVVTERELADAVAFLVDQGWLVAPKGTESGTVHEEGSYALTRHGLDEAQRKLPPEPKVYKPAERDD